MLDPLNAFIEMAPTEITAETSKLSGALFGTTLAVKDIFDVKGTRTGCGNPQILQQAKPATSNAYVVQSLLDNGADYIGKTLTDELAFSLMGQNSHYPFPINPAAPDRVTGGSSCGSVAAVAGNLADIALGSDTGGSIRAPASFCGIVGLRTTHGRISLEGSMSLAPSLDTAGWFAKDISLYEKVGDVLLNSDSHKGNLTDLIFSPELDALMLGEEEKSAYKKMLADVAPHFGSLSPAPKPNASFDDLYICFRQIQGAEAWKVHGEWISSGERNLGPGVKDRFEYGAQITPDMVATQTQLRDQFRYQLADMLGENKILVLPTVPGAAPKADLDFASLQSYREQALRLLLWSGLSGFPQITLPLGTVHNAPFGISLLGPKGSDKALIKIAKTIISHA